MAKEQTEHRHYDSLSAFVQSVQRAPICEQNNGHEWLHMNSTYFDASWVGFTSAEGRKFATKGDIHAASERRIKDGWADGWKRIQSKLKSLNVNRLHVPSPKRRAVWSDDGHEIDMDKVRMGNLDTCYRRVRKRDVMKIATVRIVVLASALAYTDPEALFWRGAAATFLADTLIRAGYNVEIIGALSARLADGSESPVVNTYKIKSALAPYSPEHIAAGLAFPGTFRSVGLRNEVIYAKKQVDSGIAQTTPSLLEPAVRAHWRDDATLCMMLEADNCAAAQKWINTQIAALGGK